MRLVLADHPPTAIQSRTRPSLRDLATGLLWRSWAAWERRQRIAQGAAELAQLDDRMLRDIGLTRFDVVRIGSGISRRLAE